MHSKPFLSRAFLNIKIYQPTGNLTAASFESKDASLSVSTQQFKNDQSPERNLDRSPTNSPRPIFQFDSLKGSNPSIASEELSPTSPHDKPIFEIQQIEEQKEFIDLDLLRMKENELSEQSQPNLHDIEERPIHFSVVLQNNKEIQPSQMFSLPQVAKHQNLEWRKCRVATEDLRVTQNLSSCLECFSAKPLAIFMPCGHGGCCLRCSVKKESKQKLCPYCSKV